MRRLNRLLLMCAFTLPALSYAVLGGDVSTVTHDNLTLAPRVSTIVTTSINNYIVSTIQTIQGQTINEYSDRVSKKVFALTWKGSSYPDFKTILGSYVVQLRTATKTKSDLTGSNLSGQDFVSKMSGIPHNLFGMVYVPSLVPANVNVNTLK